MDTGIYSFALKNTLNELQNISPDIKSAFIFKEDGEIIAGNDGTNEQTIVRVIDIFDDISEKAEVLENIESTTFDFSKGRINISHIDDLYLVTVTSQNADQNYVNTINNVLVPTILKLIKKITTTSTYNGQNTETTQPAIDTKITYKKTQKPLERVQETLTEKLRGSLGTEEAKPDAASENVTMANQFIVENIGGLLVPSDIVRVDNETLLQWEKLYDDNPIEQVEVETFGGRIAQCKVKPLKDTKFEGKGIIQMPEKIQVTLEIKKGELVRVKPIVP